MLPSSVISVLHQFLVFGVFSPSSGEAVSVRNGCSIEGHSIHCVGASGEFLPTAGTNHIRNIYITECDMSSLTYTSFAEYSEVTNIEIRQAYFSFPRQNHLFKLLSKLKNLMIEHSNVGAEVSSTYVMNDSLERLSLRGNRIAIISQQLILNQPHLKELDLSANGATRMQDDILEHTKDLRWIDLRDNRLCAGSSGVLSLAPEHCVVCRPGRFSGGCSQADVRECAAGLPLDRLWWRSPALQVRLRGNPLCDWITAPPKAFAGEAYFGDWNCKVLRKNCLLHGRRLLFLIEACGTDVTEENSPDDDITTSNGRSFEGSDDGINSFRDEKKDTEGEIERNEYAKGEEINRSENENSSHKHDSADDKIIPSGITIFILYWLGIISCCIGFGVMCKMWLQERRAPDTTNPDDGGTKGIDIDPPRNGGYEMVEGSDPDNTSSYVINSGSNNDQSLPKENFLISFKAKQMTANDQIKRTQSQIDAVRENWNLN